jgi:hypothetical protein
MYLALHNTHSPIQAPPEWEALYSFAQPLRNTFDAMVSVVDSTVGTLRVFRHNFALEDAIGSHACSLQANMRVTNSIPLGSPPLIAVFIINYVETP